MVAFVEDLVLCYRRWLCIASWVVSLLCCDWRWLLPNVHIAAREVGHDEADLVLAMDQVKEPHDVRVRQHLRGP